MSKISTMALGSIAVLAISALLSSGCNGHVSLLGQRPGPVVILVDRTIPDFQSRENQFQMIDSLAKSANETGCIFDLWSYDGQAHHLWGPSQIPSVDMLDSTENNDLKFSPTQTRKYTRPDMAITAFEKTPTYQTPSGRYYLLTDGYIGASPEVSELSSALKSFSRQPGWRIAVLGIDNQYVPIWAKLAAQSMPGRVDLVNQKQAVSLLAQNRDE